MTPAVTANALIRFARVERSISTRIGYPSQKKTDAARDVLNCVDKWTIDLHFDRWRRRRSQCSSCHHCDGGCGGCFSSFFVHRDEGLVKYLRDVEVIPRRPWRDLVEIRAAFGLIEGGSHPKRFKFFSQSNRGRLELELWQMKINVACLEFCALSQHLAGQFRFECVEAVYVVGKQNQELEIVPCVGKTHGGVSIAFGITEMLIGLSHHRNICRSSAVNMKRLWLRRIL